MKLKILEEIHSMLLDALEHCTFSPFIRGIREGLGIKQHKAAQFIGIDRQKLKKLETQKFIRIEPDILKKMADLYGVEYEIILKKCTEQVNGVRR